MADTVREAGVEEARIRFAEILGAANRDGVVTIVTKRGVPYAAVVPVPEALSQAPTLAELRGSAEGCFGDAAEFVRELRDEWP
ncbi:MAG: type II toxin-antitoxin system Phd/YefM family antitoxin [Gammaproteobacteria bacterium]|nr:type II toxin-antitoxin system Phd/YefM family antitoxin [Gammaproteobacteria bacterium]